MGPRGANDSFNGSGGFSLTWLRLDDVFHRHRKVAPLSDRAFRLHVTALLECCANGTDGHIDRRLPPTWPAFRKGRALDGAIDELVEAGLWEQSEDGWLAHDFLDWNPSAAQVRAKQFVRSEAGKKGGQRTANLKQQAKQTPKPVLEQNSSNPVSKTQATSNPVPVPDPRGEDLPPPARSTDRFMRSFSDNDPRSRADVNRVHEEFKKSVGMPNKVFVNSLDPDPATIVDAIDAYGEEKCTLVARYCGRDRMVTGEADDAGMPHKSVRYVFGNQTAFNRILGYALEHDKPAPARPDADAEFEAAMGADPT